MSDIHRCIYEKYMRMGGGGGDSVTMPLASTSEEVINTIFFNVSEEGWGHSLGAGA